MKSSPGRAPTLRAVQQWMAAAILDPQRPDTLPDNPDLGWLIEMPRRGSAAQRLHIYAAGYPARIHEALTETYSALAHLVGTSAFASLTRRFAARVALPSYNLNDAGARLPEFLHADTLTANLPFLPDLARLEWKVARAFHAVDEETFDPAVVNSWSLDDWEGAVLRFQPWVALVASDWPVRALWESRETPIADIDIDLRNRPDRVLVHRAAFSVHCQSLDEAEATALAALLNGAALGTVVASLTERGGEAGAVSSWFARWMALGMICGCRLGTEH